MKLVAIINVWADSIELLPYCVKSIAPHVDGIIICTSERSNYMEYAVYKLPTFSQLTDIPVFRCEFNPLQYVSAMDNERMKRNYALSYAKLHKYTHIITMDADEFYLSEDIEAAKKFMIQEPELNGLVVSSQVYFKSPKLTIGLDRTLVPFIHKITPELKYDFNRFYPYAWMNGTIMIDPTRSFNISWGDGKNIHLCYDINMHHYSWVRKDYELKIRNSSARANLERSTIRKDLELAKEGYFCEFYQRHLVPAQVDFGIPDFSEQNVDSKDS